MPWHAGEFYILSSSFINKSNWTEYNHDANWTTSGFGVYSWYFIAMRAASGSGMVAIRGPTHDGISTENIKLPWPAAGPATLWKVPTVNGFSSFSVGGGKAFTLISQDAEVCIALDALTGKQVWSEKLGAATYQGGGDSGLRATREATARAPRRALATDSSMSTPPTWFFTAWMPTPANLFGPST